jgi:uncharacterized protein YndB with AHSA1/START domain
MPTNKDFKRLIRARMRKTGEAYTAARAQLMRLAERPAAEAARAAEPPPAPAPAIDYARLAGVSEAAVTKQTGCSWEKWVWALDRAGATEWSHRAIAEHVHTAYKVPDWWAQTVTVGYERIKGLRAIGQRRSGAFEATRSRSIAAPAAAVFRAFADARARRAWLPSVKLTVRKATPGRSVRITWDDGTSVEVWLTARGGKTTTQVAHRKLTSQADAERRRAFWTDRLTALKEIVERPRARKAS